MKVVHLFSYIPQKSGFSLYLVLEKGISSPHPISLLRMAGNGDFTLKRVIYGAFLFCAKFFLQETAILQYFDGDLVSGKDFLRRCFFSPSCRVV